MYKNDREITLRLSEHLLYGLKAYQKDWFVLCLQGSQNYGMADEESDVDSKLMLIPSLKDLVLNRSAISHTLEMPDNQEHVDCKDVRDYMKIFRKSNINFVEVLFTDYFIVNEKYTDLWLELRKNREKLARINPYAAVSCMKGMASEKLHALCHEYPSRMSYIEKFGFDPKQLSHLYRIKFFIEQYVEGTPYEDCIYPKDETFRAWLLEGKRTGWGLNKEQAIAAAEETFSSISSVADAFREKTENKNSYNAELIINNVLYELISRSLKEQLNE